MNKHLIWAMALLLAACGTETGTVETNSTRINRVIPVVQTAQVASGTLALSDIQSITYPRALEGEGRWIKTFLHDYLDYHGALEPDREWHGGKAIQLLLNPELEAPEAYRVTVDAGGVRVEGTTGQGVFYGLQTLVQLLPSREGDNCELPNFPYCTINDAPRFEHRGLLLDCCRHFMDPEFVKRTIDHLAFYKLNVLHWHLTEDQGWRIEIKKYPRLTEHGAWRKGYNGEPYGGFYTQDQIRDIVDYAAECHVEIIPEIELPGHSSAAISSYPYLGCTGDSIEVVTEWGVFPDVYCAGKDSTVDFLKDVMDEVVALFPSKFIHIGGDEAPVTQWKECPKCQKRIAEEGLEDEYALQGWLISEIGHHLADHGKTIIGWDEILEAGDLPETATVQSWRGMEGGVEAVQHGHPAIMSPTSHCYFDYPLSSTDLPEVFAFDLIPDGLTASEAALILGGECNMWTERAPQSVIESKIYPRLLGMSEVLWRQDTAVRNYQAFERAMEAHYPLLDFMGVEYGLPRLPLDAEVGLSDGQMEVMLTPQYAGLELYTLTPTPPASGQGMGSCDTTALETLSYTLDEQEVRSQIVMASFRGKPHRPHYALNLEHHKAVGAQLSLESTYSSSYPASGQGALVDGQLDPSYGDFRSGFWQGFQGQNVVAILDMGQSEEFWWLETHFQSYPNAWIFLPDSVTFEYSEDGESWNQLPSWGNRRLRPEGLSWEARLAHLDALRIDEQHQVFVDLGLTERLEPQYKRKFFWTGIPDRKLKARYLRMTAHTTGICPEGHAAAGQPSWLFCDEIVVR